MERSLMHQTLSRRLRRSQRGQSILLMAFAFIALIAFVGLVTDIAMLFVRYSALRRAVDSAAIAAAGQIREGTDYGEVAISAQQYIELHGLNPDSVLVETCETDIYEWRTGRGPWKGQPHPEALYPKVTAAMPETELCDWDDPHKLVRVSAQINSPTTFLSLIGIKSLTLEATSVSETAVLDIALVIDQSESMSQDTSLTDYTVWSRGYSPRTDCAPGTGDVRWGGCCNDAGRGNVGDGSMQANGVLVDNGLIWHDENGNNMYDGGTERGILDPTPQTGNFNDPQTYNFTTLFCRPFKDVKDAARLFIKKLDFVRGDRVVLVTFARSGIAYDPDGDAPQYRPMIRAENIAVTTLNTKIGVEINPLGARYWNQCKAHIDAMTEYDNEGGYADGVPDPDPNNPLRPLAYEAVAPCGNTNIGGGILAGSSALTDPKDVRREAVWVMIVLSDGAANVTDPAKGANDARTYGAAGYCPWSTFCCVPGDPNSPAICRYQANGGANAGQTFSYAYTECKGNNPWQVEFAKPFCNDDNPNTRHFCLNWNTGEADLANPECGPSGNYDADDYARDMADFAGLAELTPNGKPGNFIAMFSIAFGKEVAQANTGAPLLRYIADAGDNGFIDNRLQRDLRDNGVQDYPSGGPYPTDWGTGDPCEAIASPTEKCGQYYYAENLAGLNQVFEDIAGRLFTRLSR